MSSPNMIYVKPGEGRSIRDPNSYLPMPAEGQFVDAGDTYWLSLLRFGDVVVADPPSAPAPADPVAP